MYKLYNYPILIKGGSIIVPTNLQHGGTDMLKNCIDGICNLFNNEEDFDDEPYRPPPQVSSQFVLPGDGQAQQIMWDKESERVGYDITPGSKIVQPSSEHLKEKEIYFKKRNEARRRDQQERDQVRRDRDREYNRMMRMKRN